MFPKFGLNKFVSQHDALSTLKKYWEVYSTFSRNASRRLIAGFVLGTICENNRRILHYPWNNVYQLKKKKKGNNSIGDYKRLR